MTDLTLSALEGASGITFSLDRMTGELVATGEGVELRIPFSHVRNAGGEPIANDLPSNGVTDPYLALLAEWQDDARMAKWYGERETNKRRMLFAGAFPNPKEGVQRHKLPDGRTVKGDYKVNRKIDEAALPATLEAMRAQGVANTDALVKYKPELAKREWNTLSPENKLLFSAAVIATPGTPTLEIEPAKGE